MEIDSSVLDTETFSEKLHKCVVTNNEHVFNVNSIVVFDGCFCLMPSLECSDHIRKHKSIYDDSTNCHYTIPALFKTFMDRYVSWNDYYLK